MKYLGWDWIRVFGNYWGNLGGACLSTVSFFSFKILCKLFWWFWISGQDVTVTRCVEGDVKVTIEGGRVGSAQHVLTLVSTRVATCFFLINRYLLIGHNEWALIKCIMGFRLYLVLTFWLWIKWIMVDKKNLYPNYNLIN